MSIAKKASALLAVAASSLALALVGCSASPHEVTNFVPDKDHLKKYDLIPFDGVWKNPATAGKTYDSIIVEPVFTKDAFAQRNWMERNNIRAWMEDEDQDVAEFARYTEDAFKKSLAKCKNLKLVSKAGPKTLLLELSLVKIVPGKPVLGALGNVATLTPIGLILLPVKVGANASADSPMKASVAIEGVIRDAQTKEVVATFVDREKETAAFFNANDFTAYGNLHNIVDNWARIFAEIVDKRPLKTGTKIEGQSKIKAVEL
jgi:hypothetical protein